MSWPIYWNKKNIWTNSEIWKKDVEFLYKKTFDMFNYNKKHTVLDIGCGNGDFAKKISSKVGHVYCLDTSQEFVNLCKINVANKNNVKIFKLSNDYTNLSFLKNVKFSIIIANSVVQYYESQDKIVDLVRSVKKIALKNAYFLISDIEVISSKKKSYFKLIYNTIIEGHFISLMKLGLTILMDKEYRNMMKYQDILYVNLDKLVNDLSIFVNKVTVINEKFQILDLNRKSLLIQF
jgi:2-polyprenyl-3-methyl-5-hydroxy-6-metoxy-1,4-benzoquinol methylase